MLEREELHDVKKSAASELLAAADYELLRGGEEKIVLLNCFTQIQKIFN
jgi:hypothetical protein